MSYGRCLEPYERASIEGRGREETHYTAEPLETCKGCGKEIDGIPQWHKGEPFHSYCLETI